MMKKIYECYHCKMEFLDKFLIFKHCRKMHFKLLIDILYVENDYIINEKFIKFEKIFGIKLYFLLKLYFYYKRGLAWTRGQKKEQHISHINTYHCY